MSHDDTGTDEQLYAAMRRVVDREPLTGSVPGADLARGRRLRRRRRLGGAVAVTALVPVVALLGSGLAGGSLTGSTSGSGGFADGSADDGGAPLDELTEEENACELVPIPPGDVTGQGLPSGPAGDRAGIGELQDPATIKGAQRQGKGQLFGLNSGLVTQDGELGDVEAVPPGSEADDAMCDAVPSSTIDTEVVDRLETAVRDTIDPDGEHMASLLTGISSAAAVSGGDPDGDGADEITHATLIIAWEEGSQAGGLSLSVVDADDPVAAESGCADPSLLPRPELSCETRTLADGTTVQIGRAVIAGAERISVRYDADGVVIWATADQATEQWWTEGSGAEPLAQPPATVDQLTALVRDPRVHL